jgi:DNA-binding LacI/PurR family transcriptional regulator
MTRKIRQTDIAKTSGVSISTVSRVLNGMPGISQEVRDHILGTARALGYRVEQPEPSRTRARSVVVLSTLDFLSAQAGQFHTDILHGVQLAAREAGVTLVCAPIGTEAETDAQLKAHDGVLLLSVDAPEISGAADRLHRPAGLINTEISADYHDVTVPDNEGGARKATRYLIDRGHRDILFVSHSARDTIQSRAAGYRAAMVAAFGVAAQVRVEQADYRWGVSDIHRKLDALYQDNPFSAVCCSNDITALAVIQALGRMGLRVPDDVSVVGFDDLPMAAISSPPLTTIAIDREQ